jgi:hypothetical protein
LVVNDAASPPPPNPQAAPEPAQAAAAEPRPAKVPQWTFEGVVFDLLTARGVFAAKLVFLDRRGKVVATTESGEGGRYKIRIPAGSGYTLKISHGDYPGRYLDEGEATSSLRYASPEERKLLMSAAARHLPWTGDPRKTARRDLALVPSSSESP